MKFLIKLLDKFGTNKINKGIAKVALILIYEHNYIFVDRQIEKVKFIDIAWAS